jgi:hypothetical protein
MRWLAVSLVVTTWAFGLPHAAALSLPASLDGQSAQSAIEPEVQAVYRTALALRFTADAAPLTEITLLRSTRGVLPPVCSLEEVAPADWKPVVEDYKKQNDTERELPENIDVGVPRQFISLDALKARMRAAGYDLSRDAGWQTPGIEIFSRLTGGQLIVLSAIGFNPTRTRAILTVQSNCFPTEIAADRHKPCQQGRQLVMEKANGVWAVITERGATCLWTP